MKPIKETAKQTGKRIEKRTTLWIKILVYAVSFIFIAAAVIDYGFDLNPHEMIYVNSTYNLTWWVFFLTYTLNLIFNKTKVTTKSLIVTVPLGILLYLTALAKLVPLDSAPQWLWSVWSVLGHKYFVLFVLSLFAILNVSRGMMGFLNRRMNPALLMAVGFAIIIFFGTILLLTPRSLIVRNSLSIVDALFVSTSAVCVTGLTPVNVATTFTVEGQAIIALLIQIGGLGVMTITSFFAVFFVGGTRLHTQFAMKDMFGSDTFKSLISMLLYIIGFTFAIEAAGALLIWIDIHSTMGMTAGQEVFFAVFHSISAFCNAGFSTLTGNLGAPAVMNGHSGFFLIITALIVLGGIGFPILANFKNILSFKIGNFNRHFFLRDKSPRRMPHLENVNTKVVLRTTFILIVAGTTANAFLEWNGAFAGMSVWEKLVQSLFNAVAPRTAGFTSIDLTHFSLLALVIYTFLMWIGGASQSTAGGIKVNTIAVALTNLWSVIRGENRVVLFKREISADSVRRASATVFGSIIIIILFFCILVMMEPDVNPFGLLFETVSAFSTVGSSLNITPQLGDGSKILVTVAMFIGRVGLITVLTGIVPQKAEPRYGFPKDSIIIS